MVARAGVAAALLALAAAPALAATAVDPKIAPRAGHPHTAFKVAFTAPKPAGHQGVTERSYSVELSVRRRGCAQSVVQTVPAASAGQRVHLTFRPSHRWCIGKGRGTVSMSEGPYCNPPDPCPEFATRTSDIAHFAFKVVKGS